jgi:hypothetical protein
LVRWFATTARRKLKLIREAAAAILRAGSQIRRVSGKAFGTVWNRFDIDRRKMPIMGPLQPCG